MDDILKVLLNFLPILSKVSNGYAVLTDKEGKSIRAVNSEGLEVIELRGVFFELAKKAIVEQKGMYEMSLIEEGVESWCIPIQNYVICCNNAELIRFNNTLKNSLIEALPFIARVAGGEAVVFDGNGTRLATVDPNGKSDETFIGKVSSHAKESMEKQKPIIGGSNYVSGANAVRIPITKDFGFGFNNEKDVIKSQRLIDEMKKYQDAKYNFSDIVGQSFEIDRAKEIANIAANSISSVLIYGKTGTGKEVFAQSIHNASDRCNKPFIAINCAAIPMDLMESSFFGYEEGAFTGAKKGGAQGVFEQANGGTLFLDEISEMHLDLQAKILRVLQEKKVTRIGGSKEIDLDFRMIFATNRDLEEMIKDKEFRQDLYYRLNVLDINLPSLKNIKEDIPLLINHAIKKMNLVFGLFVEGIDKDALDIMVHYEWPGNVRELMNCIEKVFNIIGKDRIIEEKHLPRKIVNKINKNASKINGAGLEISLQSYEKQIIEDALKINNGIKTETAEYLKISTTTLWRKLNQYNIKNA